MSQDQAGLSIVHSSLHPIGAVGAQAAKAYVSAARLMVAAQTANIYINIRAIQFRLDIAPQQLLNSHQFLETLRSSSRTW
ncbi:hypothetical protein [Acinetobacter sp. ANC 4640]